jgi:hypothetical protein
MLIISCALLLAALWLPATGPEEITSVLVLGPAVLAFGAVGSVLAGSREIRSAGCSLPFRC